MRLGRILHTAIFFFLDSNVTWNWFLGPLGGRPMVLALRSCVTSSGASRASLHHGMSRGRSWRCRRKFANVPGWKLRDVFELSMFVLYRTSRSSVVESFQFWIFQRFYFRWGVVSLDLPKLAKTKRKATEEQCFVQSDCKFTTMVSRTTSWTSSGLAAFQVAVAVPFPVVFAVQRGLLTAALRRAAQVALHQLAISLERSELGLADRL